MDFRWSMLETATYVLVAVGGFIFTKNGHQLAAAGSMRDACLGNDGSMTAASMCVAHLLEELVKVEKALV